MSRLRLFEQNCSYAPSVDVVDVLLCTRFPVGLLQIFADPRNDVVLEGSLDYLMEEVGGDELVYVRSRKVIGERLK